MPGDLAKRAAATTDTADRFRGKPFGWSKASTCLHMAKRQLRNMGHPTPMIPRFRSAFGAAKALKATGFPDVATLLDSIVPRIAPAEMLVGDLALMKGDDLFDAVVINAGTAVLGYHQDYLGEGLMNIVPHGDQPFIGAWRL